MEKLKTKLFDGSWNLEHRLEIRNRLEKTTYDLIVIGGGITGAGIAREGAMRGLKVALLEMQDFSAGTSSRSSKLAHGGIRYLGLGEMGLVKEATRERNWLRASIPHNIRPIPFLFVNWEGGKYKKRDIKAAVKLYDFLSDKGSEYKNFKKHKFYSKEEVLELEPQIREEGNQGGAVYYDNNMDDARITIETLKEAVIRGADVISYCEVKEYLKDNGDIIGVKCFDHEEDYGFEVKGIQVVNATGIWTDELLDNYPEEVPKPLIRPTKGVHLQYRREDVGNNMATIITSIDDERSFFVLPREDFTIIGTTDTDYEGDLADPFCKKEDADYLIRSVKHYFPNAKLDYEENLLSTYAGIRPLVKEKGKSESDISRKHIIFFSEDGLITIAGGKYTTFRQMAEDLFEEIEKRSIFSEISREKHFSRTRYLIALDKGDWVSKLEEMNINLESDIANYLYRQYGLGAIEILELIKEDNSLKERIIDENDFIKGEILYIMRYELTTHLIDVFCRRTEMSLFIDHKRQLEAAKIVVEIMAKEYSWDEEKKKEEIDTYMDYINKTVAFI
ncbi:MAG: Glycerol-3-phosphate dehydrogenase [Promethearchaeota archaeon]|nr:MAG: Glycerol-3-phosphate dehydrogenase [Candidatus Lokiarchaeota archaeon]